MMAESESTVSLSRGRTLLQKEGLSFDSSLGRGSVSVQLRRLGDQRLVTSDVTNSVRKLFRFAEEPLHFEGRGRLRDCSEFLRRMAKKALEMHKLSSFSTIQRPFWRVEFVWPPDCGFAITIP